MLKKLLFAIIITISSVYAQNNLDCDTLMIYRGKFDVFFQNQLNSVKSDSVLAIRRCNNTNGCNRPWGILCWKNGGKYKMKLFRRNGQVITKAVPGEKIKQQLILFFESKIFSITEDLNEKAGIYFHDGPATFVLFKTKQTCWRHQYVHGVDDDLRQIWLYNLIELMR